MLVVIGLRLSCFLWGSVEIASAQTRTPARDSTTAGRPSQRLGQLAGTVVDAINGRRLHDAIVTLTGKTNTHPFQALTDQNGQYLFSQLPTGDYRLTASKPGYFAKLGQATAPTANLPIRIGEGEAKYDIPLVRGGAITGQILDDSGEPVVTARVSAYRIVRASGRLMPAGPPSSTDDLGHFRLYGLMPGSYVVAAQPPMYVAAANGGGPGYAPTYFPGTPSLQFAQHLQIEAGQEGSADFTLTPATVTTITGRLEGIPGPIDVGTVLLEPGDESGPQPISYTAHATVDKTGQFSLSGVPPGDYRLIVRADSARKRWFGTRLVSLPADGTEPLSVPALPGASIAGRLRWASASAPSLRVATVTARPISGLGFGAASTEVQPDGTFVLSDVFGPVNLTAAGLGNGWHVEAIEVEGKDVTSLGLDAALGAHLRNVVLNVSTEYAAVSGIVHSEDGQPIADVQVALIAKDRNLWKTLTNKPRGYRTASTGQDGSFTFSGVRPGTYYAIVARDVDLAALADPDTAFSELTRGAKEVVAKPGGSEPLSLLGKS